jgi:hypothetical protein
LHNCSSYYQKAKRMFDEHYHDLGNPEEVRQMIIKGYDHLLVAETSCNFFWGSSWVHRVFDDLEKAYSMLDTAVAIISEKTQQAIH